MTISQNELARFQKLSTGNICDAQNKGGNMDFGIKPIDPNSKMVGPAYTVRCQIGDNLTIHKSIVEAPQGSVLVVDASSHCGKGYFGEIMAIACQARKLAGLVIDGTCRDGNDIAELGFPVFCRGLTPGGTVKHILGVTNGIIQCGGLVVHPGDIIVGDRDGVVVVPRGSALVILEKAEEIAAREIEFKKQLALGKTTLELFGLEKLI